MSAGVDVGWGLRGSAPVVLASRLADELAAAEATMVAH
jgi:hypothetical protein